MPASEAQIRANQANSLKSRGPSSPQGKAISSRNSLKAGMTGAGIVLPAEDAVEVERLALAFELEMEAEGEAGRALARRMAVSSVRMNRGFAQETASLSERVRRALDEFEPPEGLDAAEAEKLRCEVASRAMFDASKEGCLARKYEAAAEGFAQKPVIVQPFLGKSMGFCSQRDGAMSTGQFWLISRSDLVGKGELPDDANLQQSPVYRYI